MKKMVLTNSKQCAIVDDEDFEYLNQWKWRVNAQGYAVRRTYVGIGQARIAKDIRMHRIIMGEPDSKEVDHIDRDGLNNRRDNLRIADHCQNMWNRKKQYNNTSGYIGVSWSKQNKKWFACIAVKGRSIGLGHYDNIHEAVRVRDAAAMQYHGPFAHTNGVKI